MLLGLINFLFLFQNSDYLCKGASYKRHHLSEKKTKDDRSKGKNCILNAKKWYRRNFLQSTERSLPNPQEGTQLLEMEREGVGEGGEWVTEMKEGILKTDDKEKESMKIGCLQRRKLDTE